MGRWRNAAQATPREGKAGHNTLLKGTMGDTRRSPTISTKLHCIEGLEKNCLAPIPTATDAKSRDGNEMELKS
jgi:hypothetical protein